MKIDSEFGIVGLLGHFFLETWKDVLSHFTVRGFAVEGRIAKNSPSIVAGRTRAVVHSERTESSEFFTTVGALVGHE